MGDLKGKVWKFGDAVDTDVIVPGKYLDMPLEEAARHVFKSLRPEFSSEVKPGDIIVAKGNFGCGSSREQAASVLKLVGIQCVAAESFGRIFFRNAIAIGLPVAVCPGVHGLFEDGQEALISQKESRVVNLSTGQALPARPLSEHMITILENGGIIEYLKKKVREKP
jgi:3-isopropylmalate dehydratase small subunit